jgi:hypothetical protein
MVMDAAARQDSTSAIPLIFFFSFRLLMMLVILPMLMSFMVRSFIALYDQIAFMKKHKQKMFALILNNSNNKEEQDGEDEANEDGNNDQEEETAKHEKEERVNQEERSFRQTSISMFSLTDNRNFYNPKKYIEQAEADTEAEVKMSMSFRTTDISRRTVSKAVDDHTSGSGLSSFFPSFLFSGKKPTNSQPNPSSINSKSGGLFHFRPPKATKFHSSVPYIELWDMLALKEADDSALYSPTENQILLNLENYRLQMQYFSYLLYRKYHSLYYSSSFQEMLMKKQQRKQQKEVEKLKKQEQVFVTGTVNDTSDFVPILGNNYYIPKNDGSLNDPLSFPDQQDLEEEDDEQTYDFAESLYEQPMDPLSPLKRKKKAERRRSEQTKKRISIILTEIEKTDKPSAPLKSKPVKSEEKKEDDTEVKEEEKEEQNEMEKFLEKIENMLRINHSLNQVIQNIFIDFPKEDYGHVAPSHHTPQVDNQNPKKNLSRNAFQKRFSIFNIPEEDISSSDQK